MSLLDTSNVVAMPPPSAPVDTGNHDAIHRDAPMDSEVPETFLPDASFVALEKQGYTAGLIDALILNKRVFYKSIWIVDNSGSMTTTDGHRLLATNARKQVRMAECSRWKEL
jgi:hypothetical protein